ncbi:MAG: 2-dehydro-3-deoxygalactonokinase [Alphaproteobacteria bacterium]|nr:2-dehydro-3-deoxygalactonokinase [Alphaproteobacteria bacterium]
MAERFLALDWGTTNLRAWVADAAGRPLERRDFALGVASLAPGEAAARFAEQVRPAMQAQALPVLMCGMIGSALGWQAVPYADCPAPYAALAGALCRVDVAGPPVWIVPGLRTSRADGCGPDVMRGEETQIFGWAMADPARQRGTHLVCHPGTHAKWARLVDNRIDAFVTAMTGELFALLRTHSALKVASAIPSDSAFAAGLAAAGDGGALASRLFTARSRVVGGTMPAQDVESYLSGLLIGAEVAATPALLGVAAGADIAVVGDPALCALYGRALAWHGHGASLFDGEAAVLAGLAAMFRQARAVR